MGMYQVVRILNSLIDFYSWLVVAWCLLSWFPIRQGSLVGDIAEVINRIVSPYMNIFRRFIPPLGGIDFSPVVAIIALQVIQTLLTRVLLGL